MNDDLLEPRLPALPLCACRGRRRRARPRRRPAQAAPSDAAAVEAAARAFLGSLAPAERARASFAFASAERTRWHWTVPSSVPRNGLPLGAMSAKQRGLALALLRASSSTAGYRKALNIMALQGVLSVWTRASPTRSIPTSTTSRSSARPAPGRGAGGSKGTTFPGTSRSSRNTLVAEPFFLGAWPTRADSAYRSVAKGYRTMPREEDAAREIVLCSTARSASGSCSPRSR